MFVGGGVVDLVGLIFLEDFFEAGVVADGADDGFKIQIGVFTEKLLFDFIGIVFVDVENDEELGVSFGDLAAEFGAD